AVNDFHARSVTAVAVPDGKIQLGIDEPLDSRFAIEVPAFRLQQGLFDFLPDVFTPRSHGEGSPRSPKPYLHSSSQESTLPRRQMRWRPSTHQLGCNA